MFIQIQLLIQEFSNLITRPSFFTTICYAVESPFSHQKTLQANSSLIPNISRTLRLSKAQEIIVGVALRHSTSPAIQVLGTRRHLFFYLSHY